MSLYVTVRDKKRGVERQITRRAYQMMQNRYELLDAEPVEQKKSLEEKKVAAPAEIEVTQTKNEVVAKKRGPKPKNV